MKSFFLEAVQDRMVAEEALSAILPGQTNPWIITEEGETKPIAYASLLINPGEGLVGPIVLQFDLSGRHYRKIGLVLEVLTELQRKLGGWIRND